MTQKKKLTVLSGAGISAESGIPTFRGADGLWEGHRVEDVATPEAWHRNPTLVQQFYNERRKKALEVFPNDGHKVLADLEAEFDVTIITQNVDNLHERAGSTNVIHLHGELFKARSTYDETLIYDVEGWEIKMGDCCEKGSQLRPHIVWFGEAVPMMFEAEKVVKQSDFLIVVGTSMLVYPAASLAFMTNPGVPIYVVNPQKTEFPPTPDLFFIEDVATKGLKKVADILKKEN
ncbi:NAD-dependent deacylase [Limibacter armeniacum]|uniref:SIR2 family NAD-dependent protein deacylase n=1 Tax=Limibacter armeniacum TaxID=466084 RepID=UPI002FE500C9